jgi:hemin uptake protein HemP
MDGREEACAPETQDESVAIRTISSRDLLGGRAVLRIEHEGEFYTLRLTRNNRLILTK